MPDETLRPLHVCRADASIAAKPVFDRFRRVVLTSGTLSPLEMYPKMLSFTPGVSRSFEMSMYRQCIRPVVVARGADQVCVCSVYVQACARVRVAWRTALTHRR